MLRARLYRLGRGPAWINLPMFRRLPAIILLLHFYVGWRLLPGGPTDKSP